MKTKKRILVAALLVITLASTSVIASLGFKRPAVALSSLELPKEKPEQGCVFKTILEGEKIDSQFIYKTPAKVEKSIDEALDWMMKAQLNSGGWGAGSHYSQNVNDPHAVHADPATTAMVAMALLRTGNTLTSGKYSAQLNKAMEYLMKAVETSPENDLNITTEQNTQPQIKLGRNIDVVLTSQFLTNVLTALQNGSPQEQRVRKCLEKCVTKIQKGQDSNGKMQNGGWAGVLQSSLANNALETAQQNGVKVDVKALDNAREYQKSNFNVGTGSVATEDAAGVMLYSISSTSRATANESRRAKDLIEKGKKEGKLDDDDKVTAANLEKAGMSKTEASKYATAYEINVAANAKAQNADVISGFGNNGGEESLSFLQTGEGMIMGKDTGWKTWYDNTTGRLVNIQNQDGSWNGHHCITSPVFCTATCLLILSVNNDVETLISLGAKNTN